MTAFSIEMKHKNKLAIITGAAGGIGIAFANHLAARKYNLLLTDIHSRTLKKIQHDLQAQHKIRVQITALDLSNQKQTAAFSKKIKRISSIDMLVNCAGYGEGKLFHKERISDSLKMIHVHVISPVMLTHAVLKGMIKRKKGVIISVASMAAFLPAPGSSIYAGTKSFLNTFMESLHMEVEKHGIKIQSLCPGLTHTKFHSTLSEKGRNKKSFIHVPWMEAGEVVEYSLQCIDNNEVVCVPGFFNKSLKKLVPVVPRESFYKIAGNISRSA